MIIHEVVIPYKYGQEFTLKPGFDWHLGNKHCDVRAITKYLSDVDENTYFIGGGDMIDGIITSDLRRYRKSSDDTEGDDIIDQQVDKFVNFLEPLRGRIIGLGTGNHEDNIAKRCGTNPMRRAAKELDTVSLGFSWMIRMRFTEKGSRGRTLVIMGHHGWGGGSRTQGADLTKFSKAITHYDADMFLFGHVHRLQSDKIDRFSLSGPKLVSKPKLIYICGTFLKTFSMTDEATYSEVKGYPPVSIGGLNIKIKPNATWLTIESDNI